MPNQTPTPESQLSTTSSTSNLPVIFSMVFIIVCIFLTSGAFAMKLMQSEKTSTSKDTVNSAAQEKKIGTETTEDSTTHPQSQSAIITADTSQKGPWQNDLMISVSNDGISFRGTEVFEERSGVPSVIHDKTGKLLAAFQWFPEDNEQHFDKVAIKTSVDAGETWTETVPAVFVDYPDEYSRPFDPTLALTADGKIRMYFTVNLGVGPQAETAFFSAISTDGITYTFEPDARYQLEDVKLVDSAVTIFNDVYHLTGPKHEDGAYHATSNDGLTFTAEENIPSDKAYNWTGNLVTLDSSIRFYGNQNQNGKIFYSESTDGVTWSDPTDTNMNGGDPAVVQALESKFIMINVGKSQN